MKIRKHKSYKNSNGYLNKLFGNTGEYLTYYDNKNGIVGIHYSGERYKFWNDTVRYLLQFNINGYEYTKAIECISSDHKIKVNCARLINYAIDDQNNETSTTKENQDLEQQNKLN